MPPPPTKHPRRLATDLRTPADETRERLAGRLDAEALYASLRARVRAFQDRLPEGTELGLKLANFGVPTDFHIRAIWFENPNIIGFDGVQPDGTRTTLIQHISQLNFMLTALAPVEDHPYRIGFGRDLGDAPPALGPAEPPAKGDQP